MEGASASMPGRAANTLTEEEVRTAAAAGVKRANADKSAPMTKGEVLESKAGRFMLGASAIQALAEVLGKADIAAAKVLRLEVLGMAGMAPVEVLGRCCVSKRGASALNKVIALGGQAAVRGR
jgi:hypothetical protein